MEREVSFNFGHVKVTLVYLGTETPNTPCIAWPVDLLKSFSRIANYHQVILYAYSTIFEKKNTEKTNSNEFCFQHSSSSDTSIDATRNTTYTVVTISSSVPTASTSSNFLIFWFTVLQLSITIIQIHFHSYNHLKRRH